MELMLLEHYWDIHSDNCDACRPWAFGPRSYLCGVGKKYYDQWLETFNRSEP